MGSGFSALVSPTLGPHDARPDASCLSLVRHRRQTRRVKSQQKQFGGPNGTIENGTGHGGDAEN
jgi:hypothetical protein